MLAEPVAGARTFPSWARGVCPAVCPAVTSRLSAPPHNQVSCSVQGALQGRCSMRGLELEQASLNSGVFNSLIKNRPCKLGLTEKGDARGMFLNAALQRKINSLRCCMD